MFRVARLAVLLSSVFAGLLSLTAANAAEEPVLSATGISAEAAVEGYIGTLLEKMDSIKPLYEADRDAYFEQVGDALSVFVDFHEVARGVMAKYSTGPDGASEQQLQRFAGVFRESLVDFYGSALANYGGVDYEILPLRRPPSNPESSTNVRMSIEADDGSRFEVQYTMFLDDNRVWKLKNLYVEGVNLRRQYHAQFDSLMLSNGYDIDKVIDSWQVSQ